MTGAPVGTGSYPVRSTFLCSRSDRSSVTCANRGWIHLCTAAMTRGFGVGTTDGLLPMSTATPRASTRTAISSGTSPSSIGVEATHLPSLQWLNTTLRCPGCRVTLSVAPRPRASGTFRRVGPT
jgi:hypothetical protein